jgi:hypothetical protein
MIVILFYPQSSDYEWIYTHVTSADQDHVLLWSELFAIQSVCVLKFPLKI